VALFRKWLICYLFKFRRNNEGRLTSIGPAKSSIGAFFAMVLPSCLSKPALFSRECCESQIKIAKRAAPALKRKLGPNGWFSYRRARKTQKKLPKNSSRSPNGPQTKTKGEET